ncbi:IS66 family transposase [Liquorilactobacillus mali]|uniref:IS66 family transposase n=1 Tax=Liquorilactobacillus mali TaxID=1618 RepID=UPI002956EC30|nr:transposase [Liquorilactobacillus mali]
MRNISCSDKPIVYYVYGDTQSGKFAQKIYQNFTGVFQCDGYASYNLLADSITRMFGESFVMMTTRRVIILKKLVRW